MNDKKLYERILGITSPWHVAEVELKLENRQVLIAVEGSVESERCPECGLRCPRYDSKERRWRHLDTCQYQTILRAKIPRIKCHEHGVRQVRVPWAEERSRFTALFEALVIDWLRATESIGAVSKGMGLTWEEVSGIRSRAVDRGMKRRGRAELPAAVGVDETSISRGHEYITVVNALSLKHLGEAVDTVRRSEHRELRAEDDHRLSKTKYLWLTRPERLDAEARARIERLRRGSLLTARAYRYKEHASQLWGYVRRGMAERLWRQWLHGALRCALEPIRIVARMIRNHWAGVINAATSDITNAMSESVNSHIQRIKKRACGFRSRTRFREAILFHLGGLDLYPVFPSSIHSKA